MPVVYNQKIYDADVFLPYLERIPRVRRNELLKSGVLEEHPEWRAGLVEGTGGNYLSLHFKGRADASDVQNYDGETNISATTTNTYEQGVIVIGRAHAFTENDFTFELTHDEEFFDYAGQVIADFEDDVDENDLLAVLKGFEGVAGVENHIIETGDVIGATTINSAVQKACGDLKDAFAVFVCHSAIATQLENLQLLEYWKYTDEQGITRNLALGSVNGKTCIIDDNCPYDEETKTYTCYILGKGAIGYCDVGVRVPFEPARDPATVGGVDYFYYRWRKIYAPKGISFTKASLKSASPTAEELANPDNWELAPSDDGTETYPQKSIPICVLKVLGEKE